MRATPTVPFITNITHVQHAFPPEPGQSFQHRALELHGCHFGPTGGCLGCLLLTRRIRRSCTVGLWPDGSAPAKRLVTQTLSLSRPVPMSISSTSMEEDGWSRNSVSVSIPNY